MDIPSQHNPLFSNAANSPRPNSFSAKNGAAAVPFPNLTELDVLISSELSVEPIDGSGEPLASPLATRKQAAAQGSDELREAFQDFVGQTFFAEMIKACRSGQQPSAYFHGGRAEEIFQGQLDQVLSEELSKSSASKIADPMFELFMLKRQS